MRSTKLFDYGFPTVTERIANVEEVFDQDLARRKISDDIANEKLAQDTGTGKLLESVGSYILASRDIDSGRKLRYRFYDDELNYWSKSNMAKHTFFGLGDVNGEAINEYECSLYHDTEQYLNRMMQRGDTNKKFVKKFIRLGLLWENPDDYQDIWSDDLIAFVKSLSNTIKSVSNSVDLVTLRHFDGTRKIIDVAAILGTTHQNISKKLDKIAKKAVAKTPGLGTSK